MRPPLTKRPRLQPTTTPPTPLTPTVADTKGEALQEKAALARHLHEQGIDPTRWTQAHPAPQSEQQIYRDTGIKPRDNQFDANGKLYNLSPAVTATAEQAKAIGDAYMAERRGATAATPPKIEDLVDIAEVPLQHAFGTPHHQRPADDMSTAEERAALTRHYAQSGVDPDKAHLGDPLEMKDQERLKAEIKKMLPGDKSEISGLPIFYQGYDDGWIYQANEHTRASGAVAQASDHRTAANENRPNQSQVSASPEKLTDRLASRFPIIPSSIDHARTEYESAVRSLPKIVKLIDDLKAEKPLTEDQIALNAGIVAGLKRAGIKFDYQKADVDQLRAHAAGEEKYLRSIDLTDPAAVQAAIALLGLQTSEALAGGRFNTVRMQQAGSILERLKLVPELYASLSSSALGRTTAMKTSTALLSAEAAEDGPVDYEAALKEMTGLLSHAGIIERETPTTSDQVENQEQDLASASKSSRTMDAATFQTMLPTFDEVTIQIGDVVLKQHPLTTATDQIFVEELVAVASSRGCEPDPEPTRDDDEKKAIHGGNNSQRRITDVDQPGHKGSGQPDGDITMSGHGNKGAVFFNSVSTHSDGLRILAREIASAQNILRVLIKQLNAPQDVLYKLVNPAKAEGNILLYRKKWGWSLDKIRTDLREKIRKAFDQYYVDCLPKGPPQIIDLDGIGD